MTAAPGSRPYAVRLPVRAGISDHGPIVLEILHRPAADADSSVLAVGAAVWLYRGTNEDAARLEVATYRSNIALDTVESKCSARRPASRAPVP